MSAHPVAGAILVALGVYAAIGLVFAPWFVLRGAARLDPAVAGSTAGFRVILLPGAVALWPVLLARLVRGPAPSREPHRRGLP